MVDKKEIRILVIGYSLDWESAFIDRLIQGLNHSGYEITIVCKKCPSAQWIKNKRLRWVLDSGELGSMSIKSLIKRLATGVKILTLCLSNPGNNFHGFINTKDSVDDITNYYDVIYFPWIGSAIPCKNIFSTSLPVVASCRGSQINVAPFNRCFQGYKNELSELFKQLVSTHCVSHDIQKEAEKYGLDPKKAQVIYSGVNTDLFKPGEKKGSDKIKIITTGYFKWSKGIEYAVMAMKKLKESGVNFEYHLVGESPEEERLIYTIRDLNLEDKVFINQWKSDKGIINLLQNSDVFLLPSLTEGISNSVLEAMACGLPILTTDCGGMREAVEDGVEGFVVPVRDFQEIAKRLAVLYQNPSLRFDMGKKARSRIVKQFNIERQIKQFGALFDHAINNDKK